MLLRQKLTRILIRNLGVAEVDCGPQSVIGILILYHSGRLGFPQA